jgi:hypothetical protein
MRQRQINGRGHIIETEGFVQERSEPALMGAFFGHHTVTGTENNWDVWTNIAPCTNERFSAHMRHLIVGYYKIKLFRSGAKR